MFLGDFKAAQLFAFHLALELCLMLHVQFAAAVETFTHQIPVLLITTTCKRLSISYIHRLFQAISHVGAKPVATATHLLPLYCGWARHYARAIHRLPLVALASTPIQVNIFHAEAARRQCRHYLAGSDVTAINLTLGSCAHPLLVQLCVKRSQSMLSGLPV